MADSYSSYTRSLEGPATGLEAVDISAADHTAVNASRAIYVGGVGDVKVDTLDSTGVTLSSIPAGTLLPIRVTKVYKIGTTASLMTLLV